MNHKNPLTSTSKFISLVLRHQPERAGLTLDAHGWARIDDLLRGAGAAGRPLSYELLLEVVRTCPKQRFALSEDGTRVRANQGHSVEVSLDLPPSSPPAQLFHGTATRFLDSILRTGLDRRARQHVHLTEDLSVARAVGQRYGRVVLLEIDARRMHEDGNAFFRAENGVWLTEAVAVEYLRVMEEVNP